MENVKMKKLPEVVETKFAALFTALQHAADDLKIAGAEACLIGDFSQVSLINDSCRQLQTLETDIKSVINSFGKTPKIQPSDAPEFYKKKKFRTRKSRGHIRVTIADSVFEESTIAQTFVKALKAFGLERVAKLNQIITSIPLLAKTPVTNSYQTQILCDGWYVTTHVNKHTATTLLKDISRQLGTPIKIEFIE